LTPLSWTLLILFWFLLAAAAIGDVRNLRISNGMCLAVLVAAIVLLLVRQGAGPWWHHVASFAIMLGIGFGLFSAGWLGGGDAKFAAAVATLFDLRELLWFIEATALAGGLLGIALLLFRRLSLKKSGRWLGLVGNAAVPYGVAIAIGGAWVSVRLIVASA